MTQKQPLEGIKVADFSWFGAGPICAENLASFGATVVRVESESHVDGIRTVAPFPPGKTGYNVSGFFNNFNAGKLDITINLNTDLGRQIGEKLIAWCDVFLTNFTPRIIDDHTREVMRELLSNIRDGSFAREWIAENDSGLPRFKRTRSAETDHRIEDVGRSLRRMMPFVNAKEVLPGAASA